MAATMEPQETLIACDTLSEVDGETFGKPKDRSDAARMMLAFSGKSHRVLTGTCVWRPSQGEPILAVTESLLRMEKLSQDSIQTYLSTNRWIGKAGALATKTAMRGWCSPLAAVRTWLGFRWKPYSNRSSRSKFFTKEI